MCAEISDFEIDDGTVHVGLIPNGRIPSFYGCGLVLSRPDQHVAWRGNTSPADPLTLIDLVRGAAIQVSQNRTA